MKKNFFLLIFTLILCSCGDEIEPKPVITDTGITCNPIDCQVYHRGDVIPVRYVFQDGTELGAFNIEVHNNFDHHTHSTSSVECEMDAKKKASNPWVFNQDYTIPAGMKSYTTTINITIPTDIEEGDYHFMIRLTNKAGWQEIKGIAIKIKD